jgi:galactonate dehydratase
LKITDIKVIPVNKFLYVKVFTDEGISGIGESGAWGFLDASAEVVHSFKTYLIGKDPLQIEHHWQYMYRCFHFRGATIMGAISASDIALWDIAGKYFSVPTYVLLGGKCRDKVRTYYHVSGETTEELVGNCVKAKEMGYNAIGHLSPFLDEPRSKPYFLPYAKMINEAVDRVRMIREAVGDSVDLCLELHRRMKPGEAIAFGHAVEKYHPLFLEDPITPDNFDSMALIANRINVPIASPVSTAACLQIAVATENCAIQELPNHETISATERYTSSTSIYDIEFKQSDLVTWIPKAENGFIDIPVKPGIGIDLVEGIETKYPYQRRVINTRLNIDGSIVDQ